MTAASGGHRTYNRKDFQTVCPSVPVLPVPVIYRDSRLRLHVYDVVLYWAYVECHLGYYDIAKAVLPYSPVPLFLTRSYNTR